MKQAALIQDIGQVLLEGLSQSLYTNPTEKENQGLQEYRLRGDGRAYSFVYAEDILT